MQLSEAVRHLEQAVNVQEVFDPDDKTRRCDLLLALGEALMPGGDPTRAAESVVPEALIWPRYWTTGTER